MSKGKWRYKYQAKLKELMNYAKRLEKQGFNVDYSTFPKELKRVTERDFRRIESWTKEDVRLRATKETNGKRISYAEDLHRRRSEASKRGWGTRRLNRELKRIAIEEDESPSITYDYPEETEEDETPGWVQDIIDEDDIYWPGEGPISLNNVGKMLGLGDDFLRRVIHNIEMAPYDDDFAKRRERYIKESYSAGYTLTQYILDLLNDQNKVKNIYANIVQAGLKDDIFIMVNDMMFASSKTKHTASITCMTIQRIFEGASANPEYDSFADFQDWDSPGI